MLKNIYSCPIMGGQIEKKAITLTASSSDGTTRVMPKCR